MTDLGPEVIRIDEFSGSEDALELDPARLAPESPVPAQFVRNLFTDDTGRFFAGIWRSSLGRLAGLLHRERTVRPDGGPGADLG